MRTLLIILLLVTSAAAATPVKYPRAHGVVIDMPVEPQYLAIKDERAWTRFRQRLMPMVKLPKVNFKKQMVIATTSAVTGREAWLHHPEPYGNGYMVALRYGRSQGAYFDLVVVPRVRGGVEFNLR